LPASCRQLNRTCGIWAGESLQSVRLSGRGGETRRSEPAAAANFLEMLDKLREIAANWPI
jgi:hypothetical protein